MTAFFKSAFWLVVLFIGITAIWFLEGQKMTAQAPEFPNEAQAELIDQFLRANTGVPYTNPERGTIYVFPDGSYERAEARIRMNDGSPQLSPTQSEAVGALSTLPAPIWVASDGRTITVQAYNNFLLNLQGMICMGALAGLLVGGVVGICHGNWFVAFIMLLVFLGFTGLGVLLFKTQLVLFGLAATLTVPSSYASFYSKAPTRVSLKY